MFYINMTLPSLPSIQLSLYPVITGKLMAVPNHFSVVSHEATIQTITQCYAISISACIVMGIMHSFLNRKS